MGIKLLLQKFWKKYLDLKYNFLVKRYPDNLKAELDGKLKGPYKGVLSEEIIAYIPELEKGELAEDIVQQLYERARNLAIKGEFDYLIDTSGFSKLQSVEICRCYGYHSQKRWKLQLFYMPKGTEHEPHAHHNLDSFLVVLKGKIWIREFRRETPAASGKIRISKATDRVAVAYDGMITTEFGNNIHHFGAEEDTVCLNFNLRGYNKKTFLEDHKGYGRRYLSYEKELKDGVEIIYKYK